MKEWTRAAVLVAVAPGIGCPKPPGSAEPSAGGRAAAEECVVAREDLAGAGEGMWPVGMLGALDERALRARGLEIPLGVLWTEGEGGLAQAAVHLGGCSASFVSPEGLIVTNHHCAFGAVARNSTPERNLVENGFVAATRADELPGRGMIVRVLDRFEDVTDRISPDLPEDELERIREIERRESAIVAECEAAPGHRCRVARFDEGLPYVPVAHDPQRPRRRFVLFDSFEIHDVRVVAAPPRSVGEYGGEVDNWHWPRHTNDFSFIRAYVAPDGSQAEYAEDNVPYRPARWLEVSPDGVANGDLVIVMGYPWETERYMTAAEIEEQQEWYYPLRLEMFGQWIGELEAAAERSAEAAILVSSTLKGIHNARSHARGMIAALRRSGLLETRRAEEAEFRARVEQGTTLTSKGGIDTGWLSGSWSLTEQEDPERLDRYRQALDTIGRIVVERSATRDRDVLLRCIVRGSQTLGFAWTIVKWAAERTKPDAERERGFQDRDERDIRTEMREAQASLDLDGDRRVLAMFIRRALALPEEQRIAAVEAALAGDRSDAAVDAFALGLYEGTALGDVGARLGMFGAELDALRVSDDAMIRFAIALMPEMDAYLDRSKRFAERLAAVRPVLVEGLEAFRGRTLYPDANGTLRVTIGTVRGYVPADGAVYTPLTTIDGLIEKETGEDPFASPHAVLEAVRRRAHGRWADPALGSVPADFLADVDTTGGNSGSPALDDSGRLVGLLFDGVWEDLAGDFLYTPATSRSIIVDIRYVLWFLDCVAGARALLEEIGIEYAGPAACGADHP